MNRTLILASTSPARKKLLQTLGVSFETVSPNVDESTSASESIEETVKRLSLAKANAVLQKFPDAMVIGSDQLVAFEGKKLGKPENVEAAREQISQLLRKPHFLHTGIAVTTREQHFYEVDIAKVTLRDLSPVELDWYLSTNEWQGCAGAYRVESLGQWIFENIEGDRASIQGLPLLKLTRLLRSAGFDITRERVSQ